MLLRLCEYISNFSLYKTFEPIIEKICINIVKRGLVPKHIVFVADGARRFGKKHQIPVQENHEIGLHGVMLQVIDWCLLFGVAEYSILMYSFGNYHRPKDEVNHWIVVLKIWLIKCIQNWETLRRKGIKFNFYGKLELIPAEINALMALLMLITRSNGKVTVNMAMGYTGKHEMSTVAFKLYSAVRDQQIKSEQITKEVFTECLFAVENRDADLLIRTSGYKRISDFLPWQIANGLVYFSKVLWPEFSVYHFIRAIMYYQRSMQGQVRCTENNGAYTAIEYVEKSKSERKFMLIKYAIDMGFLPEKDLQHIYNLDCETVYHYFQKCYNIQ